MAARIGDRVLIVGGGIGGLAAAVALGREGIEAEVFERAPTLAEVGAGLTLWSNAVAALGRLGLAERVVPLGTAIERSVTQTASGRLLSEAIIGDASRRAGFPSVCVHRAELQGALAGAVGPGRLHLASPCLGFEATGEGVALHLDDGRTERGAVLVGADGLRSVVRERLHGGRGPRYAGYVAYRGMLRGGPPEVPPGEVRLILGPGAQVGLFPCGPGRLYWFATANVPGGSEAGCDPREALRRFRGWCRPVPEVVEATPADALMCHPVFDRPPLWPWGRGRATLLGDAAHASTPNLGQGACQALEDAVALAAALRRDGLTPVALRRYEAARRRRAEAVVRASRSLGRLLQAESRPGVWLRDALIASRLGRRRAAAMLESFVVTGAKGP